jgi:alkylation response protein AidB-like acyl-CoA dehydrogenase
MRFDLTDDQKLARDVMREFLTAECPMATVRATLDVADGFDGALWKRLAGVGWTAPLAPESHGGASLSELPVVDLSVIAAERGRAVGPDPFVETNVTIDVLARSGNTALREQFPSGLADGSVVAGWCVDHTAWLEHGRLGRLRVTRTAYGGVRLSGEVTAAVPSTDGILMVSTPSISCLLDAETPGVGIELLQWLDPSTRHATVAFDDVTVAADRIVSDAGDELERQSRLAWVLQAAELTGLIDAVFALTLNWLADPWSFGRPLASYQAIKHRCADMKMWLEASHAISDAAAEATASDAGDAGVLARAAKVYAAEHAIELIQGCMQLHGQQEES